MAEVIEKLNFSGVQSSSCLRLHLKPKSDFEFHFYSQFPFYLKIKKGTCDIKIDGKLTTLQAELTRQIPGKSLITFCNESAVTTEFLKSISSHGPIFIDNRFINSDNRSEKLMNHQGLAMAKEYLVNNWNREVTLDKLSEIANVDRHHFCRIFKKRYGVRPFSYLRIVRCSHALALILENRIKGSDIAVACAFSDQSHFIRSFKQTFSLTPNQLKKRSRGYSSDFFDPKVVGLS